MKPQEPAEGITYTMKSETMEIYQIPCECSSEDHYNTLTVSVDDCSVSVNIYTKATIDYWTYPKPIRTRYDIKNDTLQQLHWAVTGFLQGIWVRVKLTSSIWLNGNLEFHSDVLLSKQQALNYSETLRNAVDRLGNKVEF